MRYLLQPDGSLVGTTSLDLLGRLWDIRTGKGIMVRLHPISLLNNALCPSLSLSISLLNWATYPHTLW